jgi:predicted phosphodiesterase
MIKTKLICFSDTHNKIIDLKSFHEDKVSEYIFIHCGDFIEIGASAKQNEKRINAVKQFHYVVQGNHFHLERNTLKGAVHFKEISEESFEFADKLPLVKKLNISGFRILIAHSIIQCLYRDMTLTEVCKWNPESHISSEMAIMKEIARQKNDIDIYIYGHTHNQYIENINGIKFINCGCGEDNEFTEIVIGKTANTDAYVNFSMKKISLAVL